MIVRIPDPLNWWRIGEANKLLEPARARGGFATCVEPDEALFCVFEGQEMLAAATAWLSTDKFVEVKLVGGRDRHRWLDELDARIGAEAAAAGATRLVAIGRRGWSRELARLGWETVQPVDNHWLFERKLGD